MKRGIIQFVQRNLQHPNITTQMQNNAIFYQGIKKKNLPTELRCIIGQAEQINNIKQV